MNRVRQLETLAESFEDRGDYAGAAFFWQQAIGVMEGCLGKDHLDLAEYFFGAGLVCFAIDRYESAEELLLKALSIQREHLGLRHPDTVETLNCLIAMYCEQDCAKNFPDQPLHVFLDCCSSLSLPYAS